uniref:Hemagglutinin n=1 Tax=Parastrongyloides trichosuri TaxID=131310 RepID=A0A0N4ZE69_PARTI
MNGAQLLIFVRIITDIFLNLQYSSKNVDAYSLQIKAPKAEYVVTSGKNDKGKYDVTGQHVTTFDLSGDTHYGTSDPTVVNVYSNGGGTRNKSTTNSNKQITGVDVDAYNEVDSENINNIDLSKLKVSN